MAIPDEEKLQQAKAMMEAADGNMLGAQALPVGSDWPVVSLVRCGSGSVDLEHDTIFTPLLWLSGMLRTGYQM